MGTSPITLGVGNGAAMRLLLTTPAQRATPPAQDQPPGAGEAEFVICDQAIEAMFSDFKTRGFGLEDSHIERPDRMDRLILVMALAALALFWAVSTGMWDAVRNATPDEKKRRHASRAISAAA